MQKYKIVPGAIKSNIQTIALVAAKILLISLRIIILSSMFLAMDSTTSASCPPTVSCTAIASATSCAS